MLRMCLTRKVSIRPSIWTRRLDRPSCAERLLALWASNDFASLGKLRKPHWPLIRAALAIAKRMSVLG